VLCWWWSVENTKRKERRETVELKRESEREGRKKGRKEGKPKNENPKQSQNKRLLVTQTKTTKQKKSGV